MKKGIFKAGVVMVLFFSYCVFGAEWKKINCGMPKGEENMYNFKTVFFLDEKTGWIGGTARNGAGQRLIYTNDGGKNWYVINKKISANAIFFFDKKKGFLVGNGNWLYKTEDGGRTWKKVFQFDWHPWTHYLTSINFPHDPQHGWITASSFTIAYTEDGGENWAPGITGINPKTNEPKYPGGFSTCFPKDNKTGWASSSYVYFTEDGGKNWKIQTLGLYPKSIFKILFSKDLKHGWGVGCYVKRKEGEPYLHGPIIFTTDGGKKWFDAAQPYKITLYNAVLLGDKEIWAVGEKGTILHTKDGDTWEKVKSPTEETLRGIFFTGNIGWIVGEKGTVLKYEEVKEKPEKCDKK